MTRHLTPTAATQTGIQWPRANRQQPSRRAAGHATRSARGLQHPTNPTCRDSYLRPAAVGHAGAVVDPTRHLTVVARHTRVRHLTCRPHHDRRETWRPHVPTRHLPARGAR